MSLAKMQNLAEIAIDNLNLNDAKQYVVELQYNGKFNAYNANVRLRNKNLCFNLSKKWRTIDKDIQIGLIQELAMKILKKKYIKTINTDLYNIFIKKVNVAIPKTESDITLEESFNRVNENYFNNIIEIPNLKWGSYSIRKLGSYEYGSDTITISKILQNNDRFLLDYVMYHEMLHKKHKFENNNGKNMHHTKKFRTDEESYPNHLLAEKELQRLCSSIKRKNNNFLGLIKNKFF